MHIGRLIFKHIFLILHEKYVTQSMKNISAPILSVEFNKGYSLDSFASDSDAQNTNIATDQCF